MRLKVTVVGEDHHNRVKATREHVINVNPSLLQEGSARDRVAQLSEWALGESCGHLERQFGGSNSPFRATIRLKVIVAAEDHQAGLRATRDDAVTVPQHMLQEGDARTRIASIAEWAIGESLNLLAHHLGGGGGRGHAQPHGGMGGGDPISQLIEERKAARRGGPVQMPGSAHGADVYGGWQPGTGSPPPYIGEGAPPPGTAAPLDPRRIPRSDKQMVAMASEGLRRAVVDDKRKGADFVWGNENKPVKLNLKVGWGPHRRARSGQRVRPNRDGGLGM